jgi:hypothetical protein
MGEEFIGVAARWNPLAYDGHGIDELALSGSGESDSGSFGFTGFPMLLHICRRRSNAKLPGTQNGAHSLRETPEARILIMFQIIRHHALQRLLPE